MIYLFAILMLFAGAYHFINPEFYNPIMPEWFPKTLANAAGGIAELIIGVLLLLPAWRQWGLWGALALMILFLPLHVLDLLKDQPMVGSKNAAIIRLVIQFAIIGWLAWKVRAGMSKS